MMYAVTESRELGGSQSKQITSPFFCVCMGREGRKVGDFFQVLHFILGKVSVLHLLMGEKIGS